MSAMCNVKFAIKRRVSGSWNMSIKSLDGKLARSSPTINSGAMSATPCVICDHPALKACTPRAHAEALLKACQFPVIHCFKARSTTFREKGAQASQDRGVACERVRSKTEEEACMCLSLEKCKVCRTSHTPMAYTQTHTPRCLPAHLEHSVGGGNETTIFPRDVARPHSSTSIVHARILWRSCGRIAAMPPPGTQSQFCSVVVVMHKRDHHKRLACFCAHLPRWSTKPRNMSTINSPVGSLTQIQRHTSTWTQRYTHKCRRRL